MKKLLLRGVAVTCLVPVAALAHTSVSIDLGFGFPAYAAAPVYYAPPPPPPVVYAAPVYYVPASVYYPAPAYGARAYYRGGPGPGWCPPHGYLRYGHW
jgi:hypothetical protein